MASSATGYGLDSMRIPMTVGARSTFGLECPIQLCVAIGIPLWKPVTPYTLCTRMCVREWKLCHGVVIELGGSTLGGVALLAIRAQLALVQILSAVACNAPRVLNLVRGGCLGVTTVAAHPRVPSGQPVRGVLVMVEFHLLECKTLRMAVCTFWTTFQCPVVFVLVAADALRAHFELLQPFAMAFLTANCCMRTGLGKNTAEFVMCWKFEISRTRHMAFDADRRICMKLLLMRILMLMTVNALAAFEPFKRIIRRVNVRRQLLTVALDACHFFVPST
jgi:hypothetical protein